MAKISKKKQTMMDKISKMNVARIKPKAVDPVLKTQERRARMHRKINKTCKSTHILVLDIDGTIVNYRDKAEISRRKKRTQRYQTHSKAKALVARPGLHELLTKASRGFDIVLFTAGNEGHLRYVTNKFGEGVIKAGFSSRWYPGTFKDSHGIATCGKNVTFIDDDPRHYKKFDLDKLIVVDCWKADHIMDRGLTEALMDLERRFPARFAYKFREPSSEPKQKKIWFNAVM